MIDWAAALTPLNLTAVLDVARDLKDAAQLSDHVAIPLLPSVVRFPILMPVDGVNMRDRYAELRWNAVTFLQKKGVVQRVTPLHDPYDHRWQGRVQCDVDQTQLDVVLEALSTEYGRRIAESASADSGGETDSLESAIERVRSLLLRFHSVVLLLRKRHDTRPTLDVNDEYDVQDLLRALLGLSFDDVRPEEWTPSYAGGSSRVDFFLKPEQLVVEVKKTRSRLADREIGDQLILDLARYSKMVDCKAVVCFVYDPENRIVNPGGLQGDLSGTKDGLRVEVIVCPKKY